jgi:hypothetical protein
VVGAVDDGVDVRVAGCLDDGRVVVDDDRVAAEAVDRLERHDRRGPEQTTLVHEQCDDLVVLVADEDVLDAVDACPGAEAQHVLADDALALLHGGILRRR